MSYIGNTSTTQAFTPAVDYFSGNGSTVAFTLSRPVASVAQVQVNVNNVQQNPGSAYTVSGNTITFTGAPSSGTNNIYVYYTSPITQVIQPGQGTVTPASLSQGGPSWDTSGNVTLTGNITLNNGAADGAQLALSSLGSSDWNWDNYSGRLRAYYGATEYFTITNAGNVGIGTSSPGYKLDVATISVATNQSGTVRFGANDQYSLRLNTSTTAGGVPFAQVMAPKDASGWLAFTSGTSDTERMRIDSSGRVTTPYQPMFHIKLNNTANYSTTGTIPFTQVLVNVGSYYSTSTYLFTAPVAGTYMFSVKAFIEIAGRCSLNINVNGSPKQGVYGPAVQGDMLCASLIYTCAANDTVSVSLRQGTIFGDGSSGNYDAATFSGFLIG